MVSEGKEKQRPVGSLTGEPGSISANRCCVSIIRPQMLGASSGSDKAGNRDSGRKGSSFCGQRAWSIQAESPEVGVDSDTYRTAHFKPSHWPWPPCPSLSVIMIPSSSPSSFFLVSEQ